MPTLCLRTSKDNNTGQQDKAWKRQSGLCKEACCSWQMQKDSLVCTLCFLVLWAEKLEWETPDWGVSRFSRLTRFYKHGKNKVECMLSEESWRVQRRTGRTYYKGARLINMEIGSQMSLLWNTQIPQVMHISHLPCLLHDPLTWLWIEIEHFAFLSCEIWEDSQF